jgi:hypothetical protein
MELDRTENCRGGNRPTAVGARRPSPNGNDDDRPANDESSFRSMRRLKPDPVPNELIRKILEAGVCAPSGGNMQRWRFLVVRDPQIKQTVGAYYKRVWDESGRPTVSVG